jgi:hypothetical protein
MWPFAGTSNPGPPPVAGVFEAVEPAVPGLLYMYGLGMIVLGTEGAGVGVCVAVEVVDFGVGAVSKTPGVGGGGTLVEPVKGFSPCVVSFLCVEPVASCLRLGGGCSVTMICSPLVIGISDSLACGLLVTVDGKAFGGYPNFTEERTMSANPHLRGRGLY